MSLPPGASVANVAAAASVAKVAAVAAMVAVTVTSFSCARVTAPTVPELASRRDFRWTTARTEHVDLYVEENSFAAARIDSLMTRSEAAWSRVLELLGVGTYTPRISVFVVDSRERMQALIGVTTNGQAIPRRHAAFYVYNAQVDAFGAHEILHVVAKNLWGDADDWINEGLAMYADDRWQGNPLHTVASYHLERGTLIPLAFLLRRFNAHDVMTSYPAVGSFAKFIYERYGREAVRQAWYDGVPALSAATGKTLEALETEWHTVVRSSQTRLALASRRRQIQPK